MPRSRQVRRIRRAISPRLATSTCWMGRMARDVSTTDPLAAWGGLRCTRRAKCLAGGGMSRLSLPFLLLALGTACKLNAVDSATTPTTTATSTDDTDPKGSTSTTDGQGTGTCVITAPADGSTWTEDSGYFVLFAGRV